LPEGSTQNEKRNLRQQSNRISAGNNSPVVAAPIAAKLALSKPQAFVIKLEHPGGVVKSKQEKVVALSKG
jgi:hypothetical protein